MAEYEITVNDALLSNLLSGGKEGLGELVESVLNQVLEARPRSSLGRADTSGVRAGRGTGTGTGPGSSTAAWSRLCCAFRSFGTGPSRRRFFSVINAPSRPWYWALMEMVVNGVSTRKVARITEELCGTSFSKSTVSRLCTALNARVRAWCERPLGRFPFLLIDALYVKVREEERIVTKAALLVSGVNAEGYREVLGLKQGDSESEGFWRDLFEELKDRDLEGVAFVVSDEHKGLVSAIRHCFQKEDKVVGIDHCTWSDANPRERIYSRIGTWP